MLSYVQFVISYRIVFLHSVCYFQSNSSLISIYYFQFNCCLIFGSNCFLIFHFIFSIQCISYFSSNCFHFHYADNYLDKNDRRECSENIAAFFRQHSVAANASGNEFLRLHKTILQRALIGWVDLENEVTRGVYISGFFGRGINMN